MRLEPGRKVTLKLVVNFLETQREPHEVDTDAAFAKIKESVTVFD